MREIKFRGKSTDNTIWIYGDLLHHGHKVFIDNEIERTRVNENTIGQYTGLKDKNGVEIYEGDIVKVHYTSGDGTINVNNIEQVYFAYGSFMTGLYSKTQNIGMSLIKYDPEEKRHFNTDCTPFQANIEIIGNIHDNPELLGDD